MEFVVGMLDLPMAAHRSGGWECLLVTDVYGGDAVRCVEMVSCREGCFLLSVLHPSPCHHKLRFVVDTAAAAAVFGYVHKRLNLDARDIASKLRPPSNARLAFISSLFLPVPDCT